jgi:DNA-binding LacI/PurR family transcriptional regulator
MLAIIKNVLQPAWGRVTLKKIAEEAGVDVSTVSRALGGTYGVRKDTRERVLEVARRFRYRPNLIARGLVTGHSQSIGLLISDIRNPFFAEVARGAEDAAFRAAHDLVLCNSDLNQPKQMRYIRSLLDKNVTGIIMHSVATLGPGEREELAGCGVRMVLLDRQATTQPFSTVSADNHHGGLLAAQHLIQLGHRVIAHLNGPRHHTTFAERTRGFQEAVQSSDEKIATVTMNNDPTSLGGYEMTKKLLAENPDVTAIVAGNDAIALGAMRAAGECGVSIPDQLSVIGFDNIEVCDLIHPPLTTIHQPKYEMGQAAVEILLKSDQSDKTRVPEHRLFGVTLIQRQSCKPLDVRFADQRALVAAGEAYTS